MISRTATGLSVGTAARVGTSAFAAVMGFEVKGFAVEVGVTPEGALPAEAVGLAVLVFAGIGFDLVAVVAAGFAAGLFAGLAAGFDVTAALAGEFCPEVRAELGVTGAGLLAGLAGGAGFGACACFTAEGPEVDCLDGAGVAGAGLAAAA